MQLKVKTMALIEKEMMTLKPSDFVGIRILETPVEQIYIRSIHMRNSKINTSYNCPWCEEEKIHSRFDILDL